MPTESVNDSIAQPFVVVDSADVVITDSASISCKDTLSQTTASEGLPGILRQNNNSYNNSLFAYIIFALFAIITTISRKQFVRNSIFGKKGKNSEEIKHTVIDQILTILLFVTTLIMGGISILYQISNNKGVIQPYLYIYDIIKISGGIFTVFIVQQIVLWMIGNVFFTKTEAKTFLKENISCYTILALILTPTVLFLIYMPHAIQTTLITASILLILTRLIFIIRNIKNFKHDSSTTCYIILYLCTVEISPVFALYSIALNA